MTTKIQEAAAGQPVERVAQSLQEWVTLEERLLLRFYRQLNEADQVFMRRAVEAIARRDSSS